MGGGIEGSIRGGEPIGANSPWGFPGGAQRAGQPSPPPRQRRPSGGARGQTGSAELSGQKFLQGTGRGRGGGGCSTSSRGPGPGWRAGPPGRPPGAGATCPAGGPTRRKSVRSAVSRCPPSLGWLGSHPPGRVAPGARGRRARGGGGAPRPAPHPRPARPRPPAPARGRRREGKGGPWGLRVLLLTRARPPHQPPARGCSGSRTRRRGRRRRSAPRIPGRLNPSRWCTRPEVVRRLLRGGSCGARSRPSAGRCAPTTPGAARH